MFKGIEIVIKGVLGLFVGWAVVPWAADMLLRRAYHRFHSWWWDSFLIFRSHRQTVSRRCLPNTVRGEKSAIALWFEDTLAAARTGCLAKECLRALKDEGVAADVENASFSEEQQKEQFSFSAKYWQRSACGLAGAIGVAMITLAHFSFMASIAAAACYFAMLVAVVCDLRQRILPFECSVTVALFGALFQMATAGIASLSAGIIYGVLVVGICCAVNRFGRKGDVRPIGYGDIKCMAALSVATGINTWAGLFLCYACAALFVLVGVAMQKLTLCGSIPMAPFLMIWLACGIGLEASAIM